MSSTDQHPPPTLSTGQRHSFFMPSPNFDNMNSFNDTFEQCLENHIINLRAYRQDMYNSIADLEVPNDQDNVSPPPELNDANFNLINTLTEISIRPSFPPNFDNLSQREQGIWSALYISVSQLLTSMSLVDEKHQNWWKSHSKSDPSATNLKLYQTLKRFHDKVKVSRKRRYSEIQDSSINSTNKDFKDHPNNDDDDDNNNAPRHGISLITVIN